MKRNQINIYLSDAAFDNFTKIIERMNKLQALPKNSKSAIVEKILKDYGEMLANMTDNEVKVAYLRNLIFEYQVNVNLNDNRMKLDREKINLVYEALDRLLSFDNQTRLERKNMNAEITAMHKLLKNSQLEDIDILVKSLRSGVNINLYMLLSLYNRITVEGWVPEDLESFAVVSQNDEINRLIDRIGVLLKEDVARRKEFKKKNSQGYN